jgi:hypothetical protein
MCRYIYSEASTSLIMRSDWLGANQQTSPSFLHYSVNETNTKLFQTRQTDHNFSGALAVKKQKTKITPINPTVSVCPYLLTLNKI